MTVGETLEPDRKLDVGRADNILNFKVFELSIESELLNDSSIFARRQFRVILALCTSYDHFARSKDESSSLWFADTHNDGSKTLREHHISALFSQSKLRQRRREGIEV